MDDSNADYLTKYREFIELLLRTTDLDYPLPVRVAKYNIAEFEVTGEVLNWCLQYLNERSCPNSLAGPLCCKVLEEIRQVIKQDPESCGYRTHEDDFQPLKLMQLTIKKLVDVCEYYSDNAKLSTLLPPPSSLLLDPLVSVYGFKNTRRKMEDRHVAIQDLHSLFNIKDSGTASYYAIFDGHNGIEAATYSSCHVHQYLVESSHYPHNPELALREAFKRTDDRFVDKSNKERLDSGTTALCALLRPNESMLYVAWLGDSQAVLVSQGKAYQLVKPHRPDQPEERTRINEMGGSVLFVGTWRVNGHLAVSRAIGNRKYKQYVVGEPDIRVIPLTGKEEFLVLASDGLWDFVSEIDVVNAVYDYLQENKGDVRGIAQDLVRLAKIRSSQDNVSVVVVFLSEPKPYKGVRMEASEVERIWRDEEVVDSTTDYVQSCLSHYFTADPGKAKGLVVQSQAMEEETGNEVAEAEVDSADESEEEWNYIPGIDRKPDKKSRVEAAPERTLQGDGDDEDDMSRLNPNAAEFVPVLGAELDSVLSCSPAKGEERSLENVQVPKRKDFLDDISTKPSELDSTGYEFNLSGVSVNGINSKDEPKEDSDEDVVIDRLEPEPPKSSNPFADDAIQHQMVSDYFSDGLQVDLKQFDPMQDSMIILAPTTPDTPEDAPNLVLNSGEKPDFVFDSGKLDFVCDFGKTELSSDSNKPDLVSPLIDSPDVEELRENEVDTANVVDFDKCDLVASVPDEPKVEPCEISVVSADKPPSFNPFDGDNVEVVLNETPVEEVEHLDDEPTSPVLENCVNSLLAEVELSNEPPIETKQEELLTPTEEPEPVEVVKAVELVDLVADVDSQIETESADNLLDIKPKVDESEGIEVIQFNFSNVKSDASIDIDSVRHQFTFDSTNDAAPLDLIAVPEDKVKEDSGDSDGFEMLNYNEPEKLQLNGIDHSEETDQSPDNYKMEDLIHETVQPVDDSSKAALDEDFIVDEIRQEVVTASSEFYPGINSVDLEDKEEAGEEESSLVELAPVALEPVVEAVENNVVPNAEFLAQSELINAAMDEIVPSPVEDKIVEELQSTPFHHEVVVEQHPEPEEEALSPVEDQIELAQEITPDASVAPESKPTLDIPSNMDVFSSKTEIEPALVAEIIPEFKEPEEPPVEVVTPSAPFVEDLIAPAPTAAVEAVKEPEIVEEVGREVLENEPCEPAPAEVEEEILTKENGVVGEVSTPPSTPAPTSLPDNKDDLLAAAAVAVGVATVAAAASVLAAEVKPSGDDKTAKKVAAAKVDLKSPTKAAPSSKAPTKSATSAAKPSTTSLAAKKPTAASSVAPKTSSAAPKTAAAKPTTAAKLTATKTATTAKPSSPAAKPVNGVAAKPKPAAAPVSKAPLTKTTVGATTKPLSTATKTAPSAAKAPLAKPKPPTTTAPIKKPATPTTATRTSSTTVTKKPEPPKPLAAKTTTATSRPASALKPSSTTSSRPSSAAKPPLKSTVGTTKPLSTSTVKPSTATKPPPTKTTTAPSRTLGLAKTSTAAPASKAVAAPKTAAPRPKPAAPTTLKKPLVDKTSKDAPSKPPAIKGPIKKPSVDAKSKESPVKDEVLTQEHVVSTTTNGHFNGSLSDESPIDVNPAPTEVSAPN